jgi:hypothetical protein
MENMGMDFLARGGEQFGFSLGEFSDRCDIGPFVAIRDVPSTEVAEKLAAALVLSPGEAKHMQGFAAAMALFEKAKAECKGFEEACESGVDIHPREAALAAVLVLEGYALPRPQKHVYVDVGQTMDGRMQISISACKGNDNFSATFGDAEIPGPLGAFGR